VPSKDVPTDYPLVSAEHFFNLLHYYQHDYTARRSKVSNTPLLHKATNKEDYGQEIRDQMIRFHLLHCMTDRRGEKEDNLCKTKRRQSEDREEGRNSLGREADYDPTSAMSNNSPLLVE